MKDAHAFLIGSSILFAAGFNTDDLGATITGAVWMFVALYLHNTGNP